MATKMTKQHFEFIANVLAAYRPEAARDMTASATLDDITYDFARMLAKTHPNFDRARFMEAATKGLS